MNRQERREYQREEKRLAKKQTPLQHLIFRLERTLGLDRTLSPADAQTRRKIIVGLAASAVTVIGGGVTAGVRCLTTDTAPKKDSSPLQERLSLLDKSVTNLESFHRVAPEVGKLAVGLVRKDLGLDEAKEQEILAKTSFHNMADYQSIPRGIVCQGQQWKADEYEFGATFIETGKIIINLEAIYNLYNKLKRKNPNSWSLSTMLLGIFVHETLHATSATIDVTGIVTPQAPAELLERLVSVKQQGLSALAEYTDETSPTESCIQQSVTFEEEIVVIHGTNRILKKEGITQRMGNWMEAEVTRYEQFIIRGVFQDEPDAARQLLFLQQRSDYEGFYEYIGMKMNPASSNPALAGQLYFRNMVLQSP